MSSLNLASVLEHSARLTPSATAVTWNGKHLTYGELDASASRVAAGLAALGIRPGDHVALSCPNLPAFPVAYFGILKLGAVVVPLNVLLKPREIAYHLRDSHARALIVFEGTPELPMAQMARAGCDESGCPLLIVITADPSGPAPVLPALTLGQIMHSHAGHFGAGAAGHRSAGRGSRSCPWLAGRPANRRVRGLRMPVLTAGVPGDPAGRAQAGPRYALRLPALPAHQHPPARAGGGPGG